MIRVLPSCSRASICLPLSRSPRPPLAPLSPTAATSVRSCPTSATRCHGPDAASRKAELRLDTREGLTSKVVVAGQPDKSELVTRIFSEDDDERMPPPDSKLSLTPEQKTCSAAGSPKAPRLPSTGRSKPLSDKIPIPAVHDESWPRQPLDRFVLARLETEKLHPTKQADAVRLLRRATLDLTGCRHRRRMSPIRKKRPPTTSTGYAKSSINCCPALPTAKQHGRRLARRRTLRRLPTATNPINSTPQWPLPRLGRART